MPLSALRASSGGPLSRWRRSRSPAASPRALPAPHTPSRLAARVAGATWPPAQRRGASSVVWRVCILSFFHDLLQRALCSYSAAPRCEPCAGGGCVGCGCSLRGCPRVTGHAAAGRSWRGQGRQLQQRFSEGEGLPSTQRGGAPRARALRRSAPRARAEVASVLRHNTLAARGGAQRATRPERPGRGVRAARQEEARCSCGFRRVRHSSYFPGRADEPGRDH